MREDKINTEIELAKIILESKGYTVRRVDESFPKELNGLPKVWKDAIRNALKSLGIDIENTPVDAIKLSGARDPRLKQGVHVFFFPEYRDVVVYANGNVLLDARLENNQLFSKASWKYILELDPEIYFFKFDADTTQAMKDKQAARRDAQKGSVNRYKPGDRIPGKVSTKWDSGHFRQKDLDKSGYKLDPQKYQRMLQDLQVDGGPALLKKAQELYSQLAMKMSDVDYDDYRNYNVYDSIMTGITRNFADLSRAQKKYDAAKTLEDGEEKEFSIEFAQISVKQAISYLRDYVKQAEKYLNK